MNDCICKKCKIPMVVNNMLVAAYDTKDFKRFTKTGLCPYCKK